LLLDKSNFVQYGETVMNMRTDIFTGSASLWFWWCT
jgi:hypothetical protein